MHPFIFYVLTIYLWTQVTSSLILNVKATATAVPLVKIVVTVHRKGLRIYLHGLLWMSFIFTIYWKICIYKLRMRYLKLGRTTRYLWPTFILGVRSYNIPHQILTKELLNWYLLSQEMFRKMAFKELLQHISQYDRATVSSARIRFLIRADFSLLLRSERLWFPPNLPSNGY
jgi:hypothetical protein